MQPIHPIETRASDRDPFADYNRGSGWGGLIAFLVVLALIIGAVSLFAGGDTSGAPNQPAPAEAPVVPGS
jgi:hypothetical protein